jgi:O-antigen/teichoic acid export membrane protein
MGIFEKWKISGAQFYVVSQIIERGVSFLLLWFIIDAFSPEEYAQWNLVITSSGVIMSVSTIGLSMLIVKNARIWGQFRLLRYIKGFYLLLISIFMSLLLVNILTSGKLGKIIFLDSNSFKLFNILLLFTFSEALIELNISFWRSRERFSINSFIAIAKTFSKFFVVVYLAQSKVDISRILVWITLLQVIIIFISGLPVFFRKQLSASEDSEDKYLEKDKVALFVLQFTLLNLMYSANNFSDRYIIAHTLPPRSLAQYGVYSAITSFIVIIYVTINFIYTPKFANSFSQDVVNQNTFDLRKVYKLYYRYSIYIFAITLSLGSYGIKYLAHGAYSFDKNLYIGLFMSVFAFGIQLILASMIVILEKIGQLLLVVLIGSLGNLILNFLLVSELGLMGAILASLISNMTLVGGVVFILRFHYGAVFWTTLHLFAKFFALVFTVVALNFIGELWFNGLYGDLLIVCGTLAIVILPEFSNKFLARLERKY